MLTVTIREDPKMLAELFCQMTDDDQAQFFIEVAKVMSTWVEGLNHQTGSYQYGMDWQMRRVAEHLVTCPCGTQEARELIKTLAEGLKHAE